MSAGWRFALSLALTIIVSALLAPPIFRLAVDLRFIGDDEFLRVFRRLLMIGLSFSILYCFRPWRDGDLASYGLRGPRVRLGSAVFAWVVTVGIVTGLVMIEYAFGWIRLEDPLRWGRFVSRVGQFLVSGLLVAALEEWFFRGWMLRRMTRRRSIGRAVLWSTLIYALLHAFHVEHINGVDFPNTTTGALAALGHWLSHMVNFSEFGMSFLGLFFFGLLLNAAYLRWRTLWVPIAIHAGAVVVLYSYTHATDRVVRSLFVGSKLVYDGVPAIVVLAAGAVILWRWKPTPASCRMSGMAPAESGDDACGSIGVPATAERRAVAGRNPL